MGNRTKYVALALVSVLILGLLALTGTDTRQQAPAAAGAAAALNHKMSVITTTDVVDGQYYGRGSNSTWVKENLISWVARGTGDLVTFDTGSKEKRVVITAAQFKTRPYKTKFSNNLNFVLVAFSPQRVFRSTILSQYAIHDARSGLLIKQIRTKSHEEDPSEHNQAFQLAVWSNDNRTVVTVYKNDLYATRVEKDVAGGVSESVRLTVDGSDTIFNGIADWVFEEEIFVTTSTCVWTSPEGVHLSYLKFNDSTVTPVSYNLYGDYSSDTYDGYYQYPKYGTVRYPKTGRSNPTVSIHVVNIGDSACWQDSQSRSPSCTWDIPLNSLMTGLTGVKDNFIIGQFNWLSEDTFSALTFNRIQNHSWILECSTSTRVCKVIRSVSQSDGWVDNSPLFHVNNAHVTLSPVAQSDKLSYMHVVAYDSDMVRYLTRGLYSVDEIVSVGVLHKNAIVFKAPLLSVSENKEVTIQDPSQSHYYAVKYNTPSSPVCLTCYGNCTYNTAKFKGSQFVNHCEREGDVASVHVVAVNPDDFTTNVIHRLEDNRPLHDALQEVLLPEVTFLRVPYQMGNNLYNLSVKIIGPKGWRDGTPKKYPVVVDTYSGPNSQKVTKRFAPNDWSYALASNQHTPVVYVIIDGIGSGRQSSSMAFEVYRNLGDKEIRDKIFVMKHLLNTYKSLDDERTLIWGWSYGGYVSAMTMGIDTGGVFKCGISVAPVVNWFYYDTMYTERYMSTPEDNGVGYNSSNVLRYVDNFENKKFLLCSGNADDNVHYQQSMVLSRALEQRGILFRMQSYPDENHSLGGVRLHLFKTLDDFVFNHCFKKSSPQD